MKTKLLLLVKFVLFLAAIAFAHPGSGIVVDTYGQVYFTDTGKGVWKVDTKGRLSFTPASKFHWMTIDVQGQFKGAERNFGGYFEKVSISGADPSLIMCSDFPLVVNTDGNIYYVDTRRSFSRIMRRSPGGKESVVVSNKIFEFASGIAAGTDGSLFITEASNPNANTVRKITLNGKMTTIASYAGKNGREVPLETTASYCRGLAIDSKGNIYVAATGNRSVLKINPDGVIKTIVQTTGPWTPTGIALFHGDIYFLEWHDVSKENLEVRAAYLPRVRKMGKNGKVTTLVTITR